MPSNILTSLALLLTLTTPLAATCTSFTTLVSTTNFDGEKHNLTTRFSAGFACDENNPVQPSAESCTATGAPLRLALLPFFTPTNLSEATYAALYPVAGANWTSASWTTRLTGTPAGADGGVSIPLRNDEQNRTAGYMTYSPAFECRRGIVEGCDEGGEVQDGATVELCVPQVPREVNGTRYFAGGIRWVETSVEEARGLEEPTEWLMPTGNGSTLNPDPVVEETEDGEGVGVKGGPGVWFVAGMAMMSLAFVL